MRLTVVYAAILFHIAAALHAQQTLRVSVASDGTEADGPSGRVAISRDCRTVAFFSEASNLVAGDTNGVGDIFVRDSHPWTSWPDGTIRVSVNGSSDQANAVSSNPALGAKGSVIAFMSLATNLVRGDTNSEADVFVLDPSYDIQRVSIAGDGGQGNGASGTDGISLDTQAHLVAFSSTASNLVPDDTNQSRDTFVHDLESGVTSRVSVASDGSQANGDSGAGVLTADGVLVVFSSLASNLVPEDTNGQEDVFVHNRQTGETTRVSLASDRSQALGGRSFEPDISDDGLLVTFTSEAPNLVPGDTNDLMDVFLHNRQTGETSRISVSGLGIQANGDSGRSSISELGHAVVFRSKADNLVEGDTNAAFDFFARLLPSRMTERVSVANDGSQGNGNSETAAICGDGAAVAFDSGASNLVVGDLNGSVDVFVRERFLFGDGFEAGNFSEWSAVKQGSPLADFTFGVLGREVFFVNRSWGAVPLAFLWEFGDGVTSTAVDPIHVYPSPGSYEVTLTATNALGTDSIVKSVAVE